jgi:hypothetical protein
VLLISDRSLCRVLGYPAIFTVADDSNYWFVEHASLAVVHDPTGVLALLQKTEALLHSGLLGLFT